jgi:kinesin family member 13
LKWYFSFYQNGPTTIIKEEKGIEKTYTFDYSFWSHDGFTNDSTGYSVPDEGSKYADQQIVYECLGKEILNNAWEGYHCCLFAYGQTGSGKSYSMVGYGANKGIVPISCEEIFKRIKLTNDSSKSYEVLVSMLEIYNEKIQDLLVPLSKRPNAGLKVRESKYGV